MSAADVIEAMNDMEFEELVEPLTEVLQCNKNWKCCLLYFLCKFLWLYIIAWKQSAKSKKSKSSKVKTAADTTGEENAELDTAEPAAGDSGDQIRRVQQNKIGSSNKDVETLHEDDTDGQNVEDDYKTDSDSEWWIDFLCVYYFWLVFAIFVFVVYIKKNLEERNMLLCHYIFIPLWEKKIT